MENSEKFEKELMKGEKLLWTGQADPSVLFNARDIFLIPFSLMWGGFALFWEGSVLGLIKFGDNGNNPGKAAPLFMSLWGIPFVLIGLYFIFGRFFYKAWIKKQTWYALSDKRILIISKTFRQVVQTLDIKSISTVDKRISGERGTLIFGNVPMMFGIYLNSGMDFFGGSRLSGLMAFFDIPDAERVDSMIRDIRHGN